MLFWRSQYRLSIAVSSLMAVGLLLAADLCVSTAFARELAAAGSPPATTDGSSAATVTRNAADSASAPCFFRRDWKGGWKVTPDARTIYIPVSGSIYRLDLQSSYQVLKDPWAILSNEDSIDTICSPLDFRLTVSNQVGIVQSPIVKKMTRLTPEQAAALPKKLRP
jgi:hypothetical protein